jgi:hypothetical protein
MVDEQTNLDDLPMKLVFYVVGVLIGIFSWPAIDWLRSLV